MKRSLVIIFVIVLITPFIGFYLCLKYQKKIVRKEIKHRIIEGIEKDELVYFAFSSTDIKHKLRWKHSKEFEYNGEMYDVVEKKTIGDTIYYWCWWDYEETKLNKELRNLVAIALGNNQKNKENSKQILTFYKSLYCSEYKICTDNESSDEIQFTEYYNHYQAIYFPPPVPPPISG